MQSIRFWLGLMSITLSFAACKSEKTEELGQMSECDNGSYFNLQTSKCQFLAGHKLMQDSLGFSRIELANGVTVPRSINGKTPFVVSFRYQVNRRTAFDVVLKKVEYGAMGGDTYSDWAKVTVEAGEGIAFARLYPKDGKPIPEAKAANNVEGQWVSEAGYAIEIKGGDHFEDDDADSYKSWRVAGIEVDANTLDDPEGKFFILGDIKMDQLVESCKEVQGSIEVVKTDLDIELNFGLKEPGSDWRSWGGKALKIGKGGSGIFSFNFLAQDPEGKCPPPGEPVQIEPWKAEAGQYLLQLDIFDAEGQMLKFDDSKYQGVRSSLGIRVLSPSLSL